MGGATSYYAGLAAESQVAKHYEGRGHVVVARRWKGPGGEIDLIARDGAGVVFIEVKCAETFDIAAERLGKHQIARIYASASAFLASEPTGQDTDVRLELALVDATGRIEIVENAFLS